MYRKKPYRLKPARWIKNHKKKGFLLSKKCSTAEPHNMPARQCKKSHKEKRK